MDFKVVLAIIGIMLSIIAAIPYIRDILQNKTKPHLFTWIIWSVLTGTGSVIQFIGGGGLGSAVLGATALMNVVILCFSFKRSDKEFTIFDKLMFGLALLALILWRITNSPELAVILVTFASLAGYSLTYVKSIARPYQETGLFYLIHGIKHIVGIFALSAYNFLTLFLPICSLLASFGLVIMLQVRRQKMRDTASPPDPVL